MKKTIITLTASLFAMLSPAQNLISSGSPLYKLPYKNTYVMQTLVAENTFRTAKVEKPKPGSFEQAKKVLPAPYWEGHEKEIEMYWKAWQIGIKNVCQPLDSSGFVTSYISPAYNGNIFMWDDAFITMFCRYGDRFFPFQKTLDNFYAKQHPDGFICREIRADGSDCFGRYDPTSTGPNLLPWSEWLYFTQFGEDTPYPCRHHRAIITFQENNSYQPFRFLRKSLKYFPQNSVGSKVSRLFISEGPAVS